MNILLSFPDDGTANYYIINALIDAEHRVSYLNHRRYLAYAEQMMESVLFKGTTDLVIVGHFVQGETYNAKFIQKMKVLFPKVKFVALFFDSFINGELCYKNDNFISLMKSYDELFVVAEEFIAPLKDQGINAKFMRFGFDTHIYRYDHLIRDLDFSFIGQIGYGLVHKKRIDYLDALCKQFSKVEIYGGYNKLTEDIEKYHMGRPTYNDTEYSRIVARSKICFSYADSGDEAPVDGYSARVYQVLGCGGLLFHNRLPSLERDFTDGVHLILYDSIEDCIEKMKKYLDPEMEMVREIIADSGRTHVLHNYTWAHSLRYIL